MENTPAFHPLDYVSVLRRRLWWLVIPLVLAAIVGTALVAWLPREYRASATLSVSLPAVTQQLVGQTQRTDPEERRRTITQILMSDAVLQRVVREEGLASNGDVAGATQRLRNTVDIVIPPAGAGMPNGGFERFFIAYNDSAPEPTQKITNRLADVFVDESSKRREVRAEETSMFVATQLSESQARLLELEGRLRVAKEAFMGALPEQTNANVAMVTGLQQQLETTGNAIRGEQDRLSVIERQIETMRSGTAVADLNVPGVPASVSPIAVRVVQLERELATARTLYTEKHPETVRLTSDLAQARREAAAEASRPEEERTATLRIDPSYRALLGDREQARLRIRELQRQEGQIRGQIGMYRARVDSAPRVEQQIATLQREYDLEKNQYGELSSRLRTAEMSETLERNRGGEQFTVLAYAGLPSNPSSPNTQRLMLVTLLLGICAGGGLALGREYLDRSIHDARALNDLDLPVLGEIPRIAHV
jgi:succinoglycan biosynthesis transport protein ExoP